MAKDTVEIHGKQYETVASRVSRFREAHKQELSIVTELVERDEQTVVMKALILKGDQVIATGYAEENRASSTINKTSALENCETSAIGRALAAFGMAGTEYASADEVATAIGNQKSGTAVKPQPKLTGMATDKQRETITKELAKAGISIEETPGYLIETYGVEVPLTREAASFVIDDLFEQNGYVRQPEEAIA